MVLATLHHLVLVFWLILCCVTVHAKPSPASNPVPAPWDWQAEEKVDYAKYNMYEEEMKKMLEQPYFARVKNKTRVKKGEVAFLPCRVKEMVNDYTVSKKCQIEILLTLSVPLPSMVGKLVKRYL